MKNLQDLLTENIENNNNEGVLLTEGEAVNGMRIPVMRQGTGNPNLWSFGYLVFHKGPGKSLKLDFSEDGSDNGSWSKPNWSKEIFVKIEDFDPKYENLDKNKSKAIKELSKWDDPFDWTGFKMK